MYDQQQTQAAPTEQDIRKTFEGIEQDLLRRESPFERKALRNYLLHTLLAVTGRVEELFAHDTAVDSPEYVFYDTARHIRGREAIAAFHREQIQSGSSLCVPFDQRAAIGPWGFATEQTMHRFLPGGVLQRLRCALVWRCDDAGRMKSLRLYPAASHETVQLAGATGPGTEAVAAELMPLIARLKSAQ